MLCLRRFTMICRSRGFFELPYVGYCRYRSSVPSYRTFHVISNPINASNLASSYLTRVTLSFKPPNQIFDLMTTLKPLPALYTVYILRSTTRQASLYIGSTPNPPRRLKQHNGHIKGGAARTSRASLQPWEMVALVSGFPSAVAALKFEWALTNPHLSLHIPSEERISVSSQRKRNGMPKRPATSLRGIMGNMRVLLGVASFRRWPLRLHFFRRGVRDAWDAWAGSNKPLPAGLKILEDFGPVVGSVDGSQVAWGIHALPLDYSPLKSYAEKAHNVVSFEREGACVHCHEELESGKGLYPMCPNDGCEAMGHLTCWSRHALDNDGGVIPDLCSCPQCGGGVVWGDMMMELSLRVRGAAELEKLLKKKRAKKTV